MHAPAPRELFVITAPGLEPLAVAELQALGLRPQSTEPGGVSLRGTLRDLYRANLHLRTASRIVQRVAHFEARSFAELERRVLRLPWRDVVGAGRPVDVRVTCHKSRLYHSDAVAERVRSWVTGTATTSWDPDTPGGQLLIVRILRDHVTMSLDSSGDLLHLRGYRQALAKAPLRETLAAATLIASGWDLRSPLLDPMCGSGTIPIEAALMARRIAPGLARSFAFMRWPDFDAEVWGDLLEQARSDVQPIPGAIIRGSDRDAGAIEAAGANAIRAGVADDIELSRRPLSAVDPPDAGRGWIVTNPPYGVRVGDDRRLRDLYATIGQLVRDRFPGWTLAMLSASRPLERHLDLPLDEALRTTNGGIPVRVVVTRG